MFIHNHVIQGKRGPEVIIFFSVSVFCTCCTLYMYPDSPSPHFPPSPSPPSSLFTHAKPDGCVQAEVKLDRPVGVQSLINFCDKGCTHAS